VNVRLLIDAVVRQTMVLVAELATSGGLRAPLSHVAGQAFLELARELENQGVGKKVSADMFGMALRTYQRRTQRLSQSLTDRGRSLWEATLEFIEQSGVVRRDEILKRFRHDDEASLRGVLRDLTDSGLVFSSGSGQNVAFRAATKDEVSRLWRDGEGLALEAFVWSAIYRESDVSLEDLAQRTSLSAAALSPVVENLVGSGKVERVGEGEAERLRSSTLVLGFDDPAGWESSVLDHFNALVQTVIRKLAVNQRATRNDELGGSTYHFELWRGHPFESEVLGELSRFRERMSALRTKLDEYNRAQSGQKPKLRVVAYYGQSAVEEDDEDETSSDVG
jgi:DNA-binding MarR family transcriptional regulator